MAVGDAVAVETLEAVALAVCDGDGELLGCGVLLADADAVDDAVEVDVAVAVEVGVAVPESVADAVGVSSGDSAAATMSAADTVPSPFRSVSGHRAVSPNKVATIAAIRPARVSQSESARACVVTQISALTAATATWHRAYDQRCAAIGRWPWRRDRSAPIRRAVAPS